MAPVTYLSVVFCSWLARASAQSSARPYHLEEANADHFRLKEAEVYVLVGQPIEYSCRATGGPEYSWADVQFWFSDPQHELRIDTRYVHRHPTDNMTAVLRYTSTAQPRGMYIFCSIQRRTAGGVPLGVDVLHRRSFKIVAPVTEMDPEFKCHFIGFEMVDCYFRTNTDRFGVLVYNMSYTYFDHEKLAERLPQHPCGGMPQGGFHERLCVDCVYCVFAVDTLLSIDVRLSLSNNVSAHSFYIRNLEMDYHNSRLLAATDLSVDTRQGSTKLHFRAMAHSFYAEVLVTSVKSLLEQPTAHVMNASQSFADQLSPPSDKDVYTVSLFALMPDSQYVVKVRLRHLDLFDLSPTGLWSATSRHVFNTPPLPPLQPPQHEVGSFWVQSCSATGLQENGSSKVAPPSPGCRLVTLYWKPLSRLSRGSRAPLTYTLRSEHHSFKIDVPGVRNRYRMQMSDLATRYSLAARTAHGSSPPTHFYIPAADSIPAPPSKLRITGDKKVLLTWAPSPTTAEVTGYTLYWCLCLPTAELGNCSWGPEGDNSHPSAYGLRALNVSASALEASVKLPRHTEFYMFAISVQTSIGSSGMTWAHHHVIQPEVTSVTQYLIVAAVCVVLLLVVCVVAVYRYSEHLKRTVCLNIWRMPKPEVPRPPSVDIGGDKSGAGSKRSYASNRYMGSRLYRERTRLPSDLAPLCSRSFSTESSVTCESPLEAALKEERVAFAMIREQHDENETRLTLELDGCLSDKEEHVSPTDSGVDGVSLTYFSSRNSRESLQKQNEMQRVNMDAAPNGYVTVGMQQAQTPMSPLRVHTSYCQLGGVEPPVQHSSPQISPGSSPQSSPGAYPLSAGDEDSASLHSLDYNRLADVGYPSPHSPPHSPPPPVMGDYSPISLAAQPPAACSSPQLPSPPPSGYLTERQAQGLPLS